MSEVKDAVPRGFTRYYVLYLLSKNPMTGKEIIDAASSDLSLHWKPSPGLIYPMLGRLLDEGFIEEVDGKYNITEKGKAKLADYYKYQAGLIDRIAAIEELATKIADANLLVTSEVIDSVTSGVSQLRQKVGPEVKLKRIKERYRDFLKSELERINKELEGEASAGQSAGQKDKSNSSN